MLNHKGDRVIFGIDPKGKVAGQAVTDKTVDDVSNELRQIDPPVLPAIERIQLAAGNEAIVVTVGKGYVVVPAGEPARRFSTFFRTIVAEQQALVFQIRNLRNTRNLLLPRLLAADLPRKCDKLERLIHDH